MASLKLEKALLCDRYEIIGRIGAELGEESFVGRDIRAHGQTVLVRTALLSGSSTVGFGREAEIARSVAHPNIVSLLDQGSSKDDAGREISFLVYEYLAGGDINAHSRRTPTGTLPLHEVARLMEQVGSALDQIHRHSYFHPGLKPVHLLLSADTRVMKLAGVGRTVTDLFDGFEVEALQSDAYAAPALKGALGTDDRARRSNDIYALAKICYEALTGHSPVEFVSRPIDRLPAPASAEPWASDLLRILGRATSASVAERYDSAADFQRDLTAVSSEHLPREAKVQRKLSPEGKELIRKRAQFAPIEAVLAQRELELATLKVEMREFEGRYLRVVGTKHAELDELEALIAEENARLFPEDVELRIAAQRARTRASESAAAAKRHASEGEPCAEFEPSEKLKQIYRELARLIHPDTVLDREQKETRHVLMSQVNRAYEENDFGTLQNLLGDWEHSPEAVKGQGSGAELIRVIRRIDQAEARLDAIKSEFNDEERSHVFELKQQTDAAQAEGRDHLFEMASKIDYRIREGRRRLRELNIADGASS